MDETRPAVSWYTDFAACYGTMWLVMLGAALVSSSHINAGAFGMFGFPVIAAVYAFFRRPQRLEHARELGRLRAAVAEIEPELRRARGEGLGSLEV